MYCNIQHFIYESIDSSCLDMCDVTHTTSKTSCRGSNFSRTSSPTQQFCLCGNELMKREIVAVT